MGPAGVSDHIAHFAGYLRWAEDVVRTRFDLPDGPVAARSQAWSPDARPEPAAERPVDDLTGHAIRAAVGTPGGGPSLAGVKLHHPMRPPPTAVHPHDVHSFPDHPVPVAATPDVGVTSAVVTDAASPLAPAPDQQLLAMTQVNTMQNDDTEGTAAHDAAPPPHAGTVGALTSHLLKVASAMAPAALLPSNGDSAEVVGSVARHDADVAAQGQTGTVHAVQPGVYDNGVLQPAGTGIDPTLPSVAPVDDEHPHNGMTHPGLKAVTGGNVSVNAASITDDHTQHAGLVVMGDAYTTNAIEQLNILHSRSEIETAGPAGSRHIVTGHNAADNLADVHPHDAGPETLARFSPDAHVVVDRVDGNFYDVKATVQTNVLSDNDSVIQTTGRSFHDVETGTNAQINSLPLSELNGSYDLIVVQGSYHASNIVSQRNILFNDDAVKVSTARGDTASQSITTGHNTLTNTAAIDTYGNTTFEPLSAEVRHAVKHLHDGSLDTALTANLPGNGSGTVHVLFVSGDFYDVNLIAQTNIVSNIDSVAQDLAPGGRGHVSSESVSAGGNQLANLAGITTVGTTSSVQFAGGSHYDDAILVQANLVSTKAHVTVGDAHTSGGDLAALAGLHCASTGHDHAPAPVVPDPLHHHDLFHGLLA